MFKLLVILFIIKLYAWYDIFKFTKKKKDEYRTCLSVLLSDSVVKTDNYYYPQIFLQECKYAKEKEKKCLKLMNN